MLIKLTILLFLIVATLFFCSYGVQAEDMAATAELWIRESSGIPYENDGISVWSSVSPDGARRYGLIEFDLSSLHGNTISDATLRLYSAVHGWSDYEKPIKQKAYVIDCSTGTSLSALNWSTYMSEKDSGKIALETLGAYDLPPANTDPTQQGAYLDSAAAPEDLSLIQMAIDSADKFCLVLIAVEDGTDYGQTWGDAALLGLAPILHLELLTTLAYAPTPSNNAVDVGLNVTLTWQPGQDAISHNIYFGTDYNQVNNATDPYTFPGQGNQLLGNESFVPSSTLAYETPYFWRIDEVSNSGTPKGNIWQFTTMAEPVLPVHCPEGDWNGDCQVNIVDLWWLAGLWLNGTNLTDYAITAKHWQEKIGPLIISEFMASNDETLATMVEGVEVFPDWLEIYNPTTKSIDLEGWYLTDDADELDKWRFPSGFFIASQEHLVVFASDKDQDDYPDNYPFVDDTGRLHTSFNLAKGGEYLALVLPDGQTIAHAYDEYEHPGEMGFPPQETDISYGLYNGQKRYFGIPTPEQFNNGSFIDFVDDTKFSHNRGFYDIPFDAIIVCPTSGATIYYTLDGSLPLDENGNPTAASTEYIVPVHINSTTSLRAAAVKPGWRPSDVDTQTYLFPDDIIQQPEMDPEVIGPGDLYGGIYAATIKDDLKSIPTLSIVMNHEDMFGASGIYTNYSGSGEAWERACSAELFYPDIQEGFQVNCGIRIFGGGGRSWPKKSFRLLFKEDYGPTKLEYPLFPDGTVERFDTIVLRSTIDTSWQDVNATVRTRAQYIRDLWNKDTVRDMGQELALHNMFVHLYINGTYWGLYAPAERPDASYIAEYAGGDKEDNDAISHGSVVDGSITAWNDMMAIANAGVADDTSYQLLRERLDVDRFIDYILANLYSNNHDWPGHLGNRNWRAAGPREPGQGGFRVFSWDAEICFDSGWYGIVRSPDYDNVSTMGDTDGTPSRLYQRLKQNAEYRLLFGDHVHRHCFNDGALTAGKVIDRWMARANEIDRAVVAESARWGDVRQGTPPLTRNNEWITEQNRMLTQWFPDRTDYLVQFLRNNNLYPAIDAPVLNIDGIYQHGGEVAAGAELTMTIPGGGSPPAGVTFYYTLDGSDPREPGDAVAAAALTYSGPISLSNTKLIKSRAQDDSTSEWSALNEAVFSVGALKDNLSITEIMYHPPDEPISEPNAEYIELQNVGPINLNLNLVQFTEGIHFTFPDLDVPPGDFVVVGKDPAAFRTRYPGFSGTFAGTYTGSLANNGERIKLEDALGRTILDFEYEDDWREITDGGGFSLTIIDPNCPDPNAWNDKDSWRASVYWDGSPGREDSGILANPGDLVINEVLAHAPSPAYNWIELHNTTSATINLDGWYLSDNNIDEPNLMKYRIQGVNIPTDGYEVFREDLHFNNPGDPGSQVPFALSSNGGKVCLSSPLDLNARLTGFRKTEDYGASDPNVAFGRYQKSTGAYNFVAMSVNTEDSANIHPPKVGPIVIREIMYHPDWPDNSIYDNDEYEYIQLYNISSDTVFFEEDGIPWKFTNGIEYTFPLGMQLDAGECLLVVKNLTAFNWRYTVPGSVEVLEWEDGSLNNGGEKLELSRPGELGLHTRYYIRVDRVVYSDGSHPVGDDPWQPTSDADGLGSSLHRISLTEYGNDPINWQAGIPTPGN